jgi:hypothetical protein
MEKIEMDKLPSKLICYKVAVDGLQNNPNRTLGFNYKQTLNFSVA